MILDWEGQYCHYLASVIATRWRDSHGPDGHVPHTCSMLMDETLMIHDHVLLMIFHHLIFHALIRGNYCLYLCHDLMHLSIGLSPDLT